MERILLIAAILTLVPTSEVFANPNIVREQTVIKATDDNRPLFEYRFAPDVAYKPSPKALFIRRTPPDWGK